MDANVYQELVERTKSASKDAYHERVGLSATGIAGETAELAEVFRNRALYGVQFSAPVDRAKVSKEAGDLCWYIAHLLTTVDLAFEPVLQVMREAPLARDTPLFQVVFDMMIDAGKLADYLKKVAYHKIELDKAKMQALLVMVGRALLYLLEQAELVAEDVFAGNIEKLRARYPAGFNAADSLARKDGEKME